MTGSNPFTLRSIRDGQWFSSDFTQCRADFRERVRALRGMAVRECSWQVEQALADLACDVAWLGQEDAAKVLVLISGTHGVEGYCGSAIQRFLLAQLAAGGIVPGGNIALLMIHALNPWGMYWARRCDHRGIDINRNFIDFSAVPAVSDDYSEVLAAIGERDRAVREATIRELERAWGQQRFDMAFSGGQYQCDWAPFYGGQEISFSRRVIDETIAGFALAEREVVVIDLHTGLGPWAYGELISDHPSGSHGNDYGRQLFGPALAITHEGGSFSVPKRGLLDYRWHPLMQQCGCFITLEFGTYGTQSLFDCVLEDHLYWRDHRPAVLDEPGYQPQRTASIRHFCPADALWQQAVLFKGWQVFARLLEAAA